MLGTGRVGKKLGLLPVIVILVLLVLMLSLGLRGQFIFNPAYLVLVVALTFLTGVGLVVAYLSAKSYLTTGSTVLLIMSMAFVVQSAVPVGGGLASVYMPAASVGISALGLLVGSVVQLFASIQASFRSAPIGAEHRKFRLALACVVALLLSLLVMFLPFAPSFPSLFVNASGPTFINQVIYAVVIVVFLAGGFLFIRLYRQSRTNALYWYGLALLLWGIGTLGVSYQLVFSDVVAWTGRSGWYIGSLYYLIALQSARLEDNSS